ncbi:hypothetical protein H0177_24585 [Bacillus cereus]|uniref:hypothetical protein n=1 Tax=Bacillus cereus group TaxID=86661 RepID=UPI00032F53C3|nr:MULTISPECIES: hypothetical protein [Bacillus cereus group]HDX9701977.1 hypothetical protein [Bacillus thuringiensis]EOO43562.1 hypothetical protein ICK_06860 [Bacillus cereus BAG1X2-2]MBY0133427.1 hypothetical protein [Bacillus cereus]PER65605.1 hypothetical protein CN502_19525 [Bacillus cereus]PFD43740.1 hypothetical protein CN293_28450 [Bacillus cereus]
MREKEFSKGTHRLKVTKEMDVGTLLNRAHKVSTFDGKNLIVLDNGNLYDQTVRREVPVTNMFRYIKCVRNSDGIIIAKKNKPCSKLMQVIYERKAKQKMK